MVRYTFKSKDDSTFRLAEEHITQKNNVFVGTAVERLAIFENIFCKLELEQQELSANMETLRNQGLKNSVKFRDLMVKKLNNSNMLMILKLNGIE